MNYRRIYDTLIEKAKNRIIDDKTECHHIIPRCMGGDNMVTNLVLLTPEEHYIAHQLLVKIYPNNNKLISAAIMMIPGRKSNKLYGWLKRKFSNSQRENQSGNKNTQFGTIWIHNKSLKLCKKYQRLKKYHLVGKKVEY